MAVSLLFKRSVEHASWETCLLHSQVLSLSETCIRDRPVVHEGPKEKHDNPIYSVSFITDSFPETVELFHGRDAFTWHGRYSTGVINHIN